MMRLARGDAGYLLRYVPLPEAWRVRLERVLAEEIILNADEADELRELVIAELDRDGFDEHWNPTVKGKALETLIDVLYVKDPAESGAE